MGGLTFVKKINNLSHNNKETKEKCIGWY